MTPSALFYGKIAQEELTLDPRELTARLRAKGDGQALLPPDCEEKLRAALSVGYVGLKTEISLLPDGRVDMGFALLESRDLCRHLEGCKEALVLAVTLGFGVDRLLLRLGAASTSAHFFADALASALAEAALKAALERTKGDAALTAGFSPGYGDLSLEAQIPVLKALSAKERLGISLSGALLMSPAKSISAIYGLRNQRKG